MPAVIPALAGAAVTGAATATFGTLGAALAGGLVAGALSHAMAPRGQMAAVSASALSNSTSNTDPIPVIYGERKIGATRVLTETTDGDFTQEFLHVVWSICEGEIDEISTVYLDDTESDNARFSGLVTIEKYTGTDDQAASAALITALSSGSPLTPGKWTSAHQGKGVAYAYIKLKWTRDAWPGGFPVFHFLVRGRKVWDPRLGSPTVTQWSDNPALCILDYLMNARFGRGISVSKIDVQSFEDAADYCDQLVSVPASGSPSFNLQKRYTCNGILIPEAGWIDNIRALESSCRGHVVFSGGVYKLVLERAVAGSPTPTPFAFTEDNIVGGWSIRKAGKREKFNRVRARFFNPDRSWQEDFAIHDAASDRGGSDNGLLLEEEIALPFTDDVYMAQQLAQIHQKASRFGIACEFTATIAGMRCEVGDIVTVTHTTPGWDEKPFRVEKISLLSSDEVRIAAREYQASVYDLDTLTAVADTPATNLPGPFDVSAPSGLTLTQNAAVWDSLVVSWIPTDGRAAEYQVEYKLATESSYTIVPRTADTSTTIPKLQARIYDVRVKTVNSFGVSSAYTSGQVIMEGKLMRPYGSFSGLGYITKVSEISIGEGGEHMAWAPVQNLIFVACQDDSTVEVINPVTDSILAAIDVTGTPDGVTYYPPTDRIYVGASFTGSPSGTDRLLYVINPTSLAIEETISLPQGQGSGEGCYCPSNGKLYFCGADVSVVDPRSSPAHDIETIAITAAQPVTHITYCPSNDRLYVSQQSTNNVRVINPVTNAVVATVNVGSNPRGSCYSPENDRVYVVCTTPHDVRVIDPASNTVVATITGGSPNAFVTPTDVAFSIDSRLVYVTSYGSLGVGTVHAIRPSDNIVLGSAQIDSGANRILWVPSVSKIYIGHDFVGSGQLTSVGV